MRHISYLEVLRQLSTYLSLMNRIQGKITTKEDNISFENVTKFAFWKLHEQIKIACMKKL